MTFSGLTDQVRSSSQRSPRYGTKVNHITLHHQASLNDNATINMMVSGSRKVSSNYTVSNEGRITGVVDEEHRAWTSGSTTDGGKGAAMDRRSITLEIENETAAPHWKVSAKAHEAVAQLCADISRRHGFALNRQRSVEGHREIYQRYGASYPTACPGGLDMDWIVNRANEILGGAPAPAPVPSDTGGGGNAGTGTSGYNLGTAAGKAAWRGIQDWLRREWAYTAISDGNPGKVTWMALQRFLKAHYGYTQVIDGLPGKYTWEATQRWLKARYGYTQVIDGKPGTYTYAALQRAGAALRNAAPSNVLPRTPIDGKPGPVTWRRAQAWLKKDWGYTAVIDGSPGIQTIAALQRFLKAHYGYNFRIDGVAGKETYKALQRFLKAKWGYQYAIDGIAGAYTWMAFQRFVNSI